ncbi:MAG: hypothetical protein JOZ39_00565, partial [Chloroflexi bacterium]|nr:hypothetical protein [Chloroflexota bacterium]
LCGSVIQAALLSLLPFHRPSMAGLPVGIASRLLFSSWSPLLFAVFALPMLLVVSALYLVAGKLWGGGGSYPAVLAVAGYAQVPSVLLTPFLFAGSALLAAPGIPQFATPWMFMAIGMWPLVLVVIGLRHAHRLTAVHSLMSLLLAMGMLDVVMFAAFLVIVLVGFARLG